MHSGQHIETKHKVTVQQRVDRILLLLLCEQQRQVLQIRMNIFGEIKNEKEQLPIKDPVLMKAMEVMVPLAKKFVNNELRRTELKAARDEALRSLPLPGPKPAVAKRPAASHHDPEKKARTTNTLKKNMKQ